MFPVALTVTNVVDPLLWLSQLYRLPPVPYLKANSSVEISYNFTK